ncbi:ABC transporter substrate-binding protein [Xanthobacter tagetidis]|uniref:ABC transporter permease n=1 Tax=Xanthobacter tagetidis TaxID=60216 RepID=A0A3L7AI28_9HYPH|nr:ABC transporter substrate-binding protein [Xanthobacter tagetidis]MBB6306465.1 branched-chain amino acid transport system substrate-binding protein [Xanthobacter tagetidis]RLP79714.1 ABC transporter permease [Xanthobacter tagetidis]
MFWKLASRLSLAAGIAGATLAPAGAQTAKEQFIPITLYRTGPMGSFGTPPMVAYMDYMAMLNERDGGINGVKLVWEECETAYQPDRMVECYERLKGRGATVWNPYGTGLAYAVLEKSQADKIPLIMLGNGRTDAADGRYFPYAFPLVTNFWSQATAMVKYIGERQGGMDKLKGLKIVDLYHDSPYGKETIGVYDRLAKTYGFEVKHMPVPSPGIDQKSVWLQIRQYAPDWIVMQGAGLMTQTAIKEAAAIGFPRDRLVGNYWSGAEEDTVPAGAAAKNYISAAMNGSGTDFPVIQDILKYVYDRGKGSGERRDVGTTRYNRGVVIGLITMEAIRVAQAKFGEGKPITGEQMQWGLEHLNFTPERIAQLGATGLLPPFSTSCLDHEGGAPIRFQQWDGQKWVSVSDWVATDQKMVRPLIEASAAAYGKEKGISPRSCDN